MTIRDLYPDIKPSLNLDFANTKSLDPRIDFTRASTATYYDGQTFAKAEENLLKYSQEFDNASGWNFLSDANLTANTAIAPDGTTTAYELTPSVSSGKARVGTTETPQDVTVYTFSVFIKANTHNYIQINGLAGDGEFANFDLLNKVVGNKTSGTSASLTELTNGWFRCVFTTTKEILPAIQIIEQADVDNSGRAPTVSYDGTESIFIWGAQLEQRDQVTAYTPTTDQPITNYIPVLKTAAPNVPRFDHDPVTGESKGLLIEEQRTNLVPDSTTFSGSGWREGNTTVEQNVAVAPNGLIEAAKITGTGGSSGNNLRFYDYTATSRGNFTVSVYAKKGNYEYIKLHPFANTKTNSGAVFDLDTGTVVNNKGVTSKIEPAGNGWYRCQVTPIGSSYNTVWAISITDYTGSADADSNLQAPEGSFVFVWGAQTEYNSGGFISSHIPTSGSQVTRVADSASITGENFSEWYRQDEGTVFGEASSFAPLDGTNNGYIVTLTDGTDNNRWQILLRNASQGFVHGGLGNHDNGTVQTNVESKIAFSIKENDSALSLDGNQPITNSSGVVPSLIDMTIGDRVGQSGVTLNGTIKRLTYYPKRLPNAVLQTLTEE